MTYDFNDNSALKSLLGIGLLAIAIYIGVAKLPLWSPLLLGLLFTAAYIQSKWYLWRDLFEQKNSKLYSSLLATYAIQVIVVGILYLIGSGIASLFGR
jgi:hypothetical protein